MKKYIFPTIFSLMMSTTVYADNTSHKNAVISLGFTENNTSYANQAAIAAHIKAANLPVTGINGISKPLSQMDANEKAIVALSFTENNMSYANQAAIASHIKAEELSDSKINGIAKPFSLMNSNERAAIALSFTENSSAPSIRHSIEQHLIRSKSQ